MHSESREDGSHDFIDFSGRVMIWNAASWKNVSRDKKGLRERGFGFFGASF